MSIWSAPQVPTPPDGDDIKVLREYVQQLANLTAIAMKELDWLINGNVDSKNVRANSIVANRLDVKELSAITANMGKLTSGEIYGAYIATAEGTYPRIEFSSAENLLKASFDGTKYIAIRPIADTTPNLTFQDGSSAAYIFFGSGFLNILTPQKVNINANQGTYIDNLIVNNGAKLGSISVPFVGTATPEVIAIVVNEIISALRSMKIFA